jgi:hypothetical protein
MLRKALIALGSLALLSGCDTIAPANSSGGAGTTAATTAATPTPNNLERPVGASFTDTDSSNNEMTVTLMSVQDPATGADQYTTPDNGKRFVAARFKIVGKSGTFSDDANSNATVIGSDSQTYQADFSNVKGCTNFNSGSYTVTAGQTSIGCVVFQVPKGVKVAQIEWGALFGGGAPAIWMVS